MKKMSETLLIIIDINFKQNDAHKNTVGVLIPLGHYFLHNLKQPTSPTPNKKDRKEVYTILLRLM